MVSDRTSSIRRKGWFATVLFVGLFHAAGLLGTAVGTEPRLNKLVMSMIGRGTTDLEFAQRGWWLLPCVLLGQTLLFTVVLFARVRPPATYLSRIAITLLAAAILAVAWFGNRDQNIVYLTSAGDVVTTSEDRTVLAPLGGAGEELWKNRRNRDESRDLSVARLLQENGLSAFGSSHPNVLDGSLDSVRKQHPPLAYFVLSAFPFDVVRLRLLCLVVFCAGVFGMVFFCDRVLGFECALVATLLLFSAPGLVHELAFRVNLDVFVFSIGAVFYAILIPFFNGCQRLDKSWTKRELSLLLVAASVGVVGVLFKFTMLVTVGAVSIVLARRLGKMCLILIAPSVLAFIAYQAQLLWIGVPLESTYFGQFARSSVTGETGDFHGGGLVKSVVTLFVFILSPLGTVTWASGLVFSTIHAVVKRSEPGFESRELLTGAGLLNVVVVYVIHPLLRYTSPGLTAIVGSATSLYTSATRVHLLANALLSSAAAYGLTKLLVDAYL